MKPANNIKGITHHVSIAPPVRSTSVIFIAASIEIIEIKDMPIAVLKASFSIIWRLRIMVSSKIEVSNPFRIASDIIARTGQPILVN